MYIIIYLVLFYYYFLHTFVTIVLFLWKNYMWNMPGKTFSTEYNQQNCFLLNPKQRKSAFLLRLLHANVKKLRKTVLIKK